MNVPILTLDRVLIASVVDELSDSGWRELADDLLSKAIATRATGAVIDVSAMVIMDSYAGHMLTRMASALRLRGVKTVVVGVQPAVAFSMVQLGLHLESVRTALDLKDAMDLLGEARGSHGG